MSTTQRLRFARETWIKGTRGVLKPHATDMPFMKNLRYYPDGSLSTRPAWETSLIEVDSSYGASTIIFPCRMTSDAIDGAVKSGILALKDGEAKFYEYGGTLFSTTTLSGFLVRDRNTTVTNITDRLWLVGGGLLDLQYGSLDPTPNITYTNVETVIQSTFGIFAFRCKGSTVHQGRAFYWGDANTSSTPGPRNRVYYSDSVVTNGNTAYGEFGVPAGAVGAEQFFDVDGVVKGCASVGPNLMIWTEEGRWYMMQGSGDPANATFSYIGQAKIPGDGRWPIVIDRTAIFMASDQTTLVTINSGGTIDDTSMAHLGFGIGAFAYSNDAAPNIATSSLDNSTLVPYFVNTALQHYNSVWTEEEWDLLTYADFQIRTDQLNSLEILAIRTPGMSTNWQIHRREITANGVDGTAEETVVAELTLPRLSEPSKQLRVKRVIIDGVASASTTLDVAIEDGKGNSTDLTVGPGDDPFAGLSSDPVRLVYTASPQPYTHFSDIVIDNITGLDIEAITVEFDISEGPIQ